MQIRLRRAITIIYAIVIMFVLSVSVAVAQEEIAEASTGSDGVMIAIIGIGTMIIFGLGAAMSAQASDE